MATHEDMRRVIDELVRINGKIDDMAMTLKSAFTDVRQSVTLIEKNADIGYCHCRAAQKLGTEMGSSPAS